MGYRRVTVAKEIHLSRPIRWGQSANEVPDGDHHPPGLPGNRKSARCAFNKANMGKAAGMERHLYGTGVRLHEQLPGGGSLRGCCQAAGGEALCGHLPDFMLSAVVSTRHAGTFGPISAGGKTRRPESSADMADGRKNDFTAYSMKLL